MVRNRGENEQRAEHAVDEVAPGFCASCAYTHLARLAGLISAVPTDPAQTGTSQASSGSPGDL